MTPALHPRGVGTNEVLAATRGSARALAVTTLVVAAHSLAVAGPVAAIARAPTTGWLVDLVVEATVARTLTFVAPRLIDCVAELTDRRTGA